MINSKSIAIGIGGCGANVTNYISKKINDVDVLEMRENIGEVMELKSKLKEYKLVFLIAGMGGMVGSPLTSVVAQMAKELNIFTIAITVIPFEFEDSSSSSQECMEKISKNVNALYVVENEKIRQFYSDLNILDGFRKVDETIAGIIEHIRNFFVLKDNFTLSIEDLKSILIKEDLSMAKIF